MTTSTRSPRQVVQSTATKVIGHRQSLHAFLKLHYNYDAYMDLQKERKSTFFTAFKHREKLALLHNIDITVVSECLCHLKTQYLIQSPNICSGKQILLLVHSVSATDDRAFYGLSLRHHTSSFAAVENNSMQFWHTSSILCNPRTLGQNTQISSANIKWFNKTSTIHATLMLFSSSDK